jgi:anti-anti-sigma factor
MLLGVPGFAGALGSAEPPCPEQDAVIMPTASAAAASLFIVRDASSSVTAYEAEPPHRHTENRVGRGGRLGGYYDHTMVVSLAGEWDIYRRDELRNRLEPAYYEHEVILDLTAAKYVTSTLICALIVAHKHREAQRLPRAILAVKSAFVRRLLSATGLDGLFPIFESIEDARRASSTLEEETA